MYGSETPDSEWQKLFKTPSTHLEAEYCVL